MGRQDVAAAHGHSGNILLTGFWPPTNEMLRKFSTDSSLNSRGWKGENWRDSGFDIHSYFPEFESETEPYGAGFGTFRVNYADTLRDWEEVTALLRPVAIVTFSLGDAYRSWEVEDRAINRDSWLGFRYSGFPPHSPPDHTVPAGTARFSTLPMQGIVEAVRSLELLNYAFIDSGTSGPFVSEFISYLGLWYQATHSSCLSGDRCVAAGHIHVGRGIEVDDAVQAVEATLSVVVAHVSRHLTDCLSIRRIVRACPAGTSSGSVKADLFADGLQDDWGSVRVRLLELLEDC